jgi:hypothetical protein
MEQRFTFVASNTTAKLLAPSAEFLRSFCTKPKNKFKRTGRYFTLFLDKFQQRPSVILSGLNAPDLPELRQVGVAGIKLD